jgi:hypothetical protein
MPTNHFGTDGGFPWPVWPPVWSDAVDDGQAPLQWYHSTATAGAGLTNPHVPGVEGNYISSTPVISEDNVGLSGAAAILHFPDEGVQPYYVAGGVDPGYLPASYSAQLYVYNPSPVDTVAGLLWLGGPTRWLVDAIADAPGVQIYGVGGGLINQHLTLTGVPVAQTTPHVIPGGGTWVTDHIVGSTAYDILSGTGSGGFPIATENQKRRPYGPSRFDLTAPPPRFALEFALSPLHCLPVTLSRTSVSPVGSPYDDPYAFYVELQLMRTTVVAP